ncbi:MAG: hypothetical protein II452_00465 [Paludibacteraceae bacterium]|nr:hypothetical protein [Paludibacteraceae bacterium]
MEESSVADEGNVMATITQRISQFRGINRSVQQNGLDVSYAYNAENVDINGGKLSSKIGSYRMAMLEDVPPARPIPYFTNAVDYLILRQKFIELTQKYHPLEAGGYEPNGNHILQDVVCDWADNTLLIRGVGRSCVRARINDSDSVVCSGMLGKMYVDGSPVTQAYVDEHNIDDYWYYRDFYVDGATAKTCVYYLGSDTPNKKIHCREFGSGLYLLKDVEITTVNTDSDGIITSLLVNIDFTNLTDKQTSRAKLDGIYLFSSAIGSTVDEEDINNAYMWLQVADVVSGTGGKAEFTVKTTRLGTDVSTGSYIYIRGECSDYTVTFMQMYYGRLFAAAHRSNQKFPRRLFWSRLPGDGRTIEDWTQTDESVDTSGGHVDIGDPSDGFITGLVVCGNQLLIFTDTRMWRLYGTSPSNYRVELIGNLEGARISNPVEVNGTVYWLSRQGITYYNGSYIDLVDDNGSSRRMLDSFPEEMQSALYYSSVHANLFDKNIMFALDVTAHRKAREPDYDDSREYNECYVIRYDLESGNIIKYVVPCTRYRQQFTDVLAKNFGAVGGNEVKYETRYFQALVHKPKIVIDPETFEPVVEEPASMTMTQWRQFGLQEHGWYDGKTIESAWETDWDDLRQPEAVKKVHTAIMRGSGEFNLEFQSEVNKEKLKVIMPNNRGRVYEATPRYAEGRSMKMCISSDKEFEIEPYMTMIFEAGGKR